eukprot:m.19768 g.19768  ORF g.19768 m.19768 type:complete len:413 (+) comp6669_c0_seq1:141-1379(+)
MFSLCTKPQQLLRCAAHACRSLSSSKVVEKKTCLFEQHKAAGGVIVDYEGYDLPVYYKGDSPLIADADTIMASCHWTRSSASLFDVSHMCSIRWTGKDAEAFLERVTVCDVANLPVNMGKLSLITTEEGGVVDDTMLTRCSDHFYQVINCGCAEKDIAHFEEQLGLFGGDVNMEVLWDTRGLYALQGPKAQEVLQGIVGAQIDLSKVAFGECFNVTVGGHNWFVSRCGYTGEDGFEIFVDGDGAEPAYDTLVADSKVRLAGLGARDALRMEAGLCLYGHELADYTPAEAGLTWTVRKTEGAVPFLGYEPIMAQINDRSLIKKMRCGIIPQGGPAREGTPIMSKEGEEIGVITSGGFSPTLKHPISMGYVNKPLNKRGSELQIAKKTPKGKVVLKDALVVKMPFVPTNYYKPE